MIFFGLLFFSSCQKNEPIPGQQQPEKNLSELTETELRMLSLLTENDHRVSEKEATDKAVNVLNLLAQNKGMITRSGRTRAIESMKVLMMEQPG